MLLVTLPVPPPPSSGYTRNDRNVLTSPPGKLVGRPPPTELGRVFRLWLELERLAVPAKLPDIGSMSSSCELLGITGLARSEPAPVVLLLLLLLLLAVVVVLLAVFMVAPVDFFLRSWNSRFLCPWLVGSVSSMRESVSMRELTWPCSRSRFR